MKEKRGKGQTMKQGSSQLQTIYYIDFTSN
uniref:Uncharacterized protein n=1 Tax=Arundo donax TaxID=35708 RepID=A0A0A9SGJ3_ARUDO